MPGAADQPVQTSQRAPDSARERASKNKVHRHRQTEIHADIDTPDTSARARTHTHSKIDEKQRGHLELRC